MYMCVCVCVCVCVCSGVEGGDALTVTGEFLEGCY